MGTSGKTSPDHSEHRTPTGPAATGSTNPTTDSARPRGISTGSSVAPGSSRLTGTAPSGARTAANGPASTERTSLLDGTTRPIRVRGYGASQGDTGARSTSGSAVGGSSPRVPHSQTLPAPPSSSSRPSNEAEEGDDEATVEGMARDLVRQLRRRQTLPSIIAAESSETDSSASASYDAVLFEHSSLIDAAFPTKAGAEEDDDGGVEATAVSASTSDTALLLSAVLFLLGKTSGIVGSPVKPVIQPIATTLKQLARQRALALPLVALATALLDNALLDLSSASAGSGSDTALLTLFWGEAPLSSRDSSCVSVVDILFSLASHLRVPAPGLSPPLTFADLHPILSHPLVPCATELAFSSGLIIPPSNAAPTRPTSLVATDEEASLPAVQARNGSSSIVTFVDSFATPSLLHAHALLLSCFYFILTAWIVVGSEAKHFHHFNPFLPPDGRVQPPGPAGTAWRQFAWWWWVLSTVGYFTICIQTTLRGPLPRLPIRCAVLPSAAFFTQLPFILTFVGLLVRFIGALSGHDRAPYWIVPAYVCIAWSVPLFAFVAFVLPSNIPALNPSVLHSGAGRSSIPPTISSALAVEARLAELMRALAHFALFLLVTYLLFLIASFNAFLAPRDIFNVVAVWRAFGVPPPGDPDHVAPYEGRFALSVGVGFGLLAVVFLGLQGPRQNATGVVTPSAEKPSTRLAGPSSEDTAILDRVCVVRHYLVIRPFESKQPGLSSRSPALPPPLNLLSLVFGSAPAAVLRIALISSRASERQQAVDTTLWWPAFVDCILWRTLVAPALIVLFGWPRLFRAIASQARAKTL